MKLKWLIVLCLAVAAFATPSAAQEKADDVIKVNTTFVSVPVIVCDRQGRYIADIKQEEFGILQDGVEQKIDFFASSKEPINVALLVDTSSSTRDVLGDIKSAGKKLIKLLNADDKAMILSFDGELHMLSTLSSDKKDLEKAVGKAKIADSGGTILREAVDEAVRKQFADVRGRKAVILLTDGVDHGSAISSSRLIRVLEESDATVYTVYFNTMGGRFYEKERPTEFLNRLSEVTAGRVYDSKKTKFDEAFTAILDELRHQYRLGYYPPEETAKNVAHSIQVKVMRRDLVVRARSTYRPKTK